MISSFAARSLDQQTSNYIAHSLHTTWWDMLTWGMLTLSDDLLH